MGSCIYVKHNASFQANRDFEKLINAFFINILMELQYQILVACHYNNIFFHEFLIKSIDLIEIGMKDAAYGSN